MVASGGAKRNGELVNRQPKKPLPTKVDLEPQARRIDKPWGWEIIWADEGAYTGKVIHVNAAKRLSLQYHDEKVETQCLVSGRALLILEDQTGELREIEMERGKGYTIHPFQIHRIVAIEDADIYEVSTAETGITVRLSDDYLRPDETAELRASPGRGWLAPDPVRS